MLTVAQDYCLISFTGQDKHFDEALAKAQQKANEWLAASELEFVSITNATVVAPNGKFVCGLTIAYRPSSSQVLFESDRASDSTSS